MASAYYSNTVHIDFASVLAMENPCMVSVFNALMASGLEGFLGCPAVIYESELVDFFKNGSVRDGLVVNLSKMPKDKIFDARSIVSMLGEPVSLSGRKGQMKIEYRLLCDIMAKSISVKAGSFNALTVEKFSLLTAVVCGIRMNWARILFNILKKMVTSGSKQAKGFAVQISLLLESIPNLRLGESSEFPASKILTDKTVHRYISINDKVGVEEAVVAPPMKKASRKPAASKKRPAVAAGEEIVPKKKKTSKKKSGSSPSTLEIVVVAQEAVPIQMVEPSTGVPTAEEPVEQPAADISADQPVDEVTGVLDGEEAVATEVDASADRDQPADITDERQWFDLSHEELIAKWAAERQVEQVLTWVGTDSPIIALHRKRYILFKYRELLVRKFLEARRINFVPRDGSSAVDLKILDKLHSFHLFVLEELKTETLAHDLEWKLPCCSIIFEGQNRDRGAVIARSNTTTRSSCWIRTMIRVTGTWVIEPCADQWAKIPQPIISNEVPSQRQYDDTLPLMSEFFTLLKKRWADICLEIVGFCASRRLLPVGSLHFCRSLSVVEPVF
ncbi:dystroglycan-like [Dorcoceras hygrometricum]|uniref:Dystroglycan-like n=1 Tax=Dorcoceras hygrometricum TaxID=472368 RepID=A0A2Z7B5I8_9LAMI|nr:dystroglycan-like [Dorcoceras hygrometricum]